MNYTIKQIGLLVSFAFVVTLLLGCDTLHGVSRTVAVSDFPSGSQVSQALHTISAYVVQDMTAEGITQFSVKRGLGFAAVRLGPKAQDRQRILLSSFRLRKPSPDELTADRQLLDDVYAALRREIPTLPPSSEITEESINLPK